MIMWERTKNKKMKKIEAFLSSRDLPDQPHTEDWTARK